MKTITRKHLEARLVDYKAGLAQLVEQLEQTQMNIQGTRGAIQATEYLLKELDTLTP
jgi:soluble cytochrome b562